MRNKQYFYLHILRRILIESRTILFLSITGKSSYKSLWKRFVINSISLKEKQIYSMQIFESFLSEYVNRMSVLTLYLKETRKFLYHFKMKLLSRKQIWRILCI